MLNNQFKIQITPNTQELYNLGDRFILNSYITFTSYINGYTALKNGDIAIIGDGQGKLHILEIISTQKGFKGLCISTNKIIINDINLVGTIAVADLKPISANKFH